MKRMEKPEYMFIISVFTLWNEITPVKGEIKES